MNKALATLGPIWTAIIAAIGGFGVGFMAYLGVKRTVDGSRANQAKQSETTLVVAQMDDRKDVTHVLQQSLQAAQQEAAALRAEVAAFRIELDKAKGDFLDYRDKLGMANVEIREQKGRIEAQQGQISELVAENVRRKQESEETISKLHDENVSLQRDVQVLQGENKELRQSLSRLRRQVQGNIQEARTIGLPELRGSESYPATTEADGDPER